MNVLLSFTIFLVSIGSLLNSINTSDLTDRVEALEAEKRILCKQVYKIQSKHNYVLECSGVLK